MRPTVTDRVAWSVGLSVTILSVQKQLNQSRCHSGYGSGGPKEPLLDGSPNPHMLLGNFEGKSVWFRTCPAVDILQSDSAGGSTGMMRICRLVVLDGGAHGCYLVNTISSLI